MAGFAGFGRETIAFLAGLSAHNEKAWFDAHRADYEADYLTPAIGFAAALADPLERLAPGIRVEPRINGSIFRINRDVRFSKDKRPYKDHLDLWFWHGERKGAVSGLFFRLTKDRLIVGAGAHMFAPAQLAAYRSALGDPARAQALLRIERELAGAWLELQGERFARVPRGVAVADPSLERLSKFDALHAFVEEPHPPSLPTPRFVDHCVERWRPLVPLHEWLVSIA